MLSTLWDSGPGAVIVFAVLVLTFGYVMVRWLIVATLARMTKRRLVDDSEIRVNHQHDWQLIRALRRGGGATRMRECRSCGEIEIIPGDAPWKPEGKQ